MCRATNEIYLNAVYQDQPGEVPTNYQILLALSCQGDVVSLPRGERLNAFDPDGLSAGEKVDHATVERRVSLLRRFRPRRRSLLEPLRARAGQPQRLLALMRVDHDVVPDMRGQRAAGDVLHFRAVVIADPDAADIVRGVADEPGVARILAGPRLAAGDLVRQRRLPPGAANHRRVHHVVHFRDIGLLDDAGKLRPRVLVEQLAVAIAHAGDDMRGNPFAAISERHIGGDEL